MCRHVSTRLLVLAFATLALIWPAAATRALAAPAPNLLQVEISLVGGATRTLGEPVILHYRMTNASDQEVSVFMGLDGGLDGTEWVTHTLADSRGGAVPSLSDPHRPDPGGVHFNGPVLSPGTCREGYLVASQWFTIPGPAGTS